MTLSLENAVKMLTAAQSEIDLYIKSPSTTMLDRDMLQDASDTIDRVIEILDDVML